MWLRACLLSIKFHFLPSGQCVKSVYTFNAVAALCFVPEGDGYIITGSGVFLRGQKVCGIVKKIIGPKSCCLTSDLCHRVRSVSLQFIFMPFTNIWLRGIVCQWLGVVWWLNRPRRVSRDQQRLPVACRQTLTSYSATLQMGGKFKPGAGTLSKTASQSTLTGKQSPPSRCVGHSPVDHDALSGCINIQLNRWDKKKKSCFRKWLK